MIKTISLWALVALGAILAPASTVGATNTDPNIQNTPINKVEATRTDFTPPSLITASSTVSLKFERPQVTSSAAPKPEPKPDPTPAPATDKSTVTPVAVTAPSISPDQTPTNPSPTTNTTQQIVADAAAPPAVSVTPGSAQAEAAKQLQGHGWGADQLACLVSLWQKESGWNLSAENSSSGAYGIPQSLPGSKMASAGSDWRTNPATQIKWGLGYIADRYQTPCGAWSHSIAVGWY